MLTRCQNCGAVFEAKTRARRWCSDRCRHRANYLKHRDQDDTPAAKTLGELVAQAYALAGDLAIAGRIAPKTETAQGFARLSIEIRTTLKELGF